MILDFPWVPIAKSHDFFCCFPDTPLDSQGLLDQVHFLILFPERKLHDKIVIPLRAPNQNPPAPKINIILKLKTITWSSIERKITDLLKGSYELQFFMEVAAHELCATFFSQSHIPNILNIFIYVLLKSLSNLLINLFLNIYSLLVIFSHYLAAIRVNVSSTKMTCV